MDEAKGLAASFMVMFPELDSVAGLPGGDEEPAMVKLVPELAEGVE